MICKYVPFIVTPPNDVTAIMVTNSSAIILWVEPSALVENGPTLRRYDIL